MDMYFNWEILLYQTSINILYYNFTYYILSQKHEKEIISMLNSENDMLPYLPNSQKFLTCTFQSLLSYISLCHFEQLYHSHDNN